MIGHPRIRISNTDRIGSVHVARLKVALTTWRGTVFESLLHRSLHITHAEAPLALLQLVHTGVLEPTESTPEERCWVVGEYGRRIMDAVVPPRITKERSRQLARSFLAHAEELSERPETQIHLDGVAFGPEYFTTLKMLPFLPVDVYVRTRASNQLDPRAIEMQLSELDEHLLVRVFPDS